MSVKHVCPNCGSTLTLDAPMPSLRCPRCKTAMQPETVAAQTTAADAAAARPMRVARTVGSIGQPTDHATTNKFLEEARLQIKQERDRLLEDAQKQIEQQVQELESELQKKHDEKIAAAEAEAQSILETAQQNAKQLQEEAETAAAKIQSDAEETARQIKAEAEKNVQDVKSQPAQQSLEQKKAEIDQIAHRNQLRFWRLNAYVALLILTFISALKASGNTLVAVLSWLAAIISLVLTALGAYNLRTCIMLLKSEKKAMDTPPPANNTPTAKSSDDETPKTMPSSKPTKMVLKPKTVAKETTDQPAPAGRRPLLALSKKSPSKPLFIKKKNSSGSQKSNDGETLH